MDGEEDDSFGEVEQPLRPGSAAKDIADMWKEIGEIKQKIAEIREIQDKLFEEYVVVASSQDPTKAEDDTQMENYSNKNMEEVYPTKAVDDTQMENYSNKDVEEVDPTKAEDDDTQMENYTNKDLEEVDPLSIFVGNVDYGCRDDEVRQHFEACGAVKRVTIVRDMYGQSKGYAYVEFADEEAVEEALRLNQSQLHGRKLKVMRKRRNVPGMKRRRQRHFYSPYGHSPRFRRPQ